LVPMGARLLLIAGWLGLCMSVRFGHRTQKSRVYKAMPIPGQVSTTTRTVPLIETADMNDPGVTAANLQALAGLFAKEPPAALGPDMLEASTTIDVDPMGLTNDPLDTVGVGEEGMDRDMLAQEVAQLKAEINNDEQAANDGSKRKKDLAALQGQLDQAQTLSDQAKATADRNTQIQKQRQRTAAASAKIRALDYQINGVKHTLGQLQTERDQWAKPIGNQAGSATAVSAASVEAADAEAEAPA